MRRGKQRRRTRRARRRGGTKGDEIVATQRSPGRSRFGEGREGIVGATPYRVIMDGFSSALADRRIYRSAPFQRQLHARVTVLDSPLDGGL